MKKSIFFFGLLTMTGIFLTACGSKNYEMSFDEALEIASHSAFQDILSNNENIQQSFEVNTNINNSGSNIAANLKTNSKQSTEINKSDSSIKFDIDIDDGNGVDIKVNGDLSIKLVDESLYLNLESLDLTGSENATLLAAMLAGFKSQWFSMPMSGLNDMSDGYLKNMRELNAKTKEIVNNEGLLVYEGKFTQFNGYNARKISLNNEKLQEIIDEYYKSINDSIDNSIDEDNEVEIPQLNIENFEGYLVITGKDKVTIVVDNMDMVDGETSVKANGFGGEDYALNLSSQGEDVITLTANRKGSKYEVVVNITDTMSLNGTIVPKISKSSISIDFDVILKIKSDGESDTVVPLKGSRTYEPISEFEVIAPENSQDLTEMIGSYLGAMVGGDDYDEDFDYENYVDEIHEGTENNIENNVKNDVENSTESTETSVVETSI